MDSVSQCNPKTDCSPKKSIPCELTSCKFLSNFSRPVGQPSWPGKPRDVLTNTFTATCQEKTFAGLNISWRPPVDGSIHHLKAFKLTVQALEGSTRGRAPICVLFDLRDAEWTVHDFNAVFSHSFLLDEDNLYRIRLQCLPEPELQHQTQVTWEGNVILPRMHKDWIANISCTVQLNRSIEVSFPAAPVSRAFDVYRVLLHQLNTSSVETRLKQIQPEQDIFPNTTDKSILSTVFHNVTPGMYDIYVWPGGGNCDNDCVRTVKAFNISYSYIFPKPYWNTSLVSVPVMASKNSSDVIKNAVTPAVICIIVVTFLFTALFLRKRRRRHQHQQQYDTVRLLSPTRKQLFLLFIEENDSHMTVVKSLAQYLQTYCFCDVLFVDWFLSELRSQGIQSWVRESLHNAHVILVINSSKTANQINFRAECSDNLDDSLYTTVFEMAVSDILSDFVLQRKCADVSFGVRDEQHVFEGTETKHYIFMDDFRDFMADIHNLCGQSSKYDLPFEGSHSKTEEGKQLLQTISNLKTFSSKLSSGYYSEDDAISFCPPESVVFEEDKMSISGMMQHINANT